jgi:probable HAF family extracellular repeat protein
MRKFLFAFLALAFCVLLVPTVRTQQQNTQALSRIQSAFCRHRPLNVLPSLASAAAIRDSIAQASGSQTIKVYDLGYYPTGSWSEPRGINDAGLVVAFGDIDSASTCCDYVRPIAVPLFGPNAFQWFDLGTLGGDRTDAKVMCMGVSDTGMIVGHSALLGGEPVQAFAWTRNAGMVDIGALGNGRDWSLAYGVNKSGTLIVGWSSSQFLGPDSLPVVWTPRLTFGPHGLSTTWTIQQLDITGFEGATYWNAGSVNDLGQIIGTAVAADGTEIAVLWNPILGRKNWKIMQLPLPSNYPNAWPDDINDKGQIVGGFATVDWSTQVPALWNPMHSPNNTYKPILLTTLVGSNQGWAEAEGINDLDDIVGYSYDAEWNMYATRFCTQNPNFIEVIGFPGTWSWAYRVNDDRIAVGSYGSDSVMENTVAAKLK